MSAILRIRNAAAQGRIRAAAQPARIRTTDTTAALTPILPNSLVSSAVGGGSVSSQAALVLVAPNVDGLATYLAATALSALRAVWLTADGLRYASVTDADSCDAVLAITTQAAAAQAACIVRCSGTLSDPNWQWLQGDAVFLGADGLLTQSPDEALPLVELGIAITPQALLVRIQTPFF